MMMLRFRRRRRRTITTTIVANRHATLLLIMTMLMLIKTRVSNISARLRLQNLELWANSHVENPETLTCSKTPNPASKPSNLKGAKPLKRPSDQKAVAL